MGIFDRRSDDPTPASEADESALSSAGTRLVQRLLDIGIDGKGRFDSARTVSQTAKSRRSDPERAIDDLVSDHLKLAAGGGFVTGLGGFVTLPVALPANVAGFYIIATRMAAAILDIRGYDIDTASTRSALLLSLVGADADDILRKAGRVSTGRLSQLAEDRLPGAIVMAVNKGVGFRLVTQTGKKVFSRFGRGVPFLGGVLGAGLDGWMMKRIADHVRQEFPDRGAGQIGPA